MTPDVDKSVRFSMWSVVVAVVVVVVVVVGWWWHK
jgi:hypothetical protein